MYLTDACILITPIATRTVLWLPAIIDYGIELACWLGLQWCRQLWQPLAETHGFVGHRLQVSSTHVVL